ncbi:hypothetical protein NDU88_002472 [Pleurodeles waltl]|uniref:Uncharacterized protein n=1 Tax=Pleurodeles waltl TaxID=8319 RepID=A0AAV7MRJ2_PLEWA|nr:hypothetical protein NDU88_002472 [Pleurodeles waltl]
MFLPGCLPTVEAGRLFAPIKSPLSFPDRNILVLSVLSPEFRRDIFGAILIFKKWGNALTKPASPAVATFTLCIESYITLLIMPFVDQGWVQERAHLKARKLSQSQKTEHSPAPSYAHGAAPGAFFQAALGRGIIPVFMEGRASLALAAFCVRVRCGSPAPAGVRDQGGRGRKAAPSLRVRHLAPAKVTYHWKSNRVS